MSAKTKKIDREFILSDSSVNVYGFRLMTAGYQINQFKKNPIGYHMHDRDNGVVVKWEDLRVEGDKVLGKPVINMSNARGQQTVDEIENGFLNAASVGKLVALEISSDPKDYLPDQKGPTVTKWFNREASLVDIPGNYEALTELVDINDEPINLSDFKPQFKIMEKIFLTPEQIMKLSLKADAKQDEVNTAFADLIAKAGKVDQLTTDLSVATNAKTKAEKDLADLKASTTKESVKNILDAGLAEGKFTKETRAKLEKKFADDVEGLKDLVADMKPYKSVVEGLDAEATDADKVELKALMAKTGDQLFTEGKLEKLKELDLASYKIKHKEAFGEDYKEVK